MEIAKTFKEVIWNSPFYGIFLTMINKYWDEVEKIRIIKKPLSYELSMNRLYFENITPENRRAHIMHEVIHIALMHPLRLRDFEDKKVAHYAMDVVVNQYIDPYWWDNCPTRYLNLDRLALECSSLNLPTPLRDESVKYYYDILKEIEKLSDSSVLVDMDTSDFKIDTGDNWNDFATLSDVESKLLQKVTEGMLINARDGLGRGRGSIPGELGSIFEMIDVEEPPKFNWRNFIRKFIGNNITTDVKSSRFKENFRFPDTPGRKIKQNAKILVAIDTSESVSKDELMDFFLELKHIDNTGIAVDVIQCDTKMYDVKPIKEYTEDNLIILSGRGGTDFNPPVDYYNSKIKEYQALIYFTDGECSPPDKSPPNILWVFSSISPINTLLPGTVIQIS